MSGPSKPHAAILHPALGLGGAERLILQFAEALEADGWCVSLWVNDFDPERALSQASGRDIRMVRAWAPASIAGRLRAWCAVWRQRAAARALARAGGADLVVVDLVPHIVPQLLRQIPGAPILAYCHFPDQLLAPGRERRWYRWYRRRLDWLEQQGLRQADRILVNSRYTRSALENLHPDLQRRPIAVVYPGVTFDGSHNVSRFGAIVLSLCRIHPTKNHRLAMAAFLAAELPGSARLVIAGGYDEKDAACRRELARLQDLVGHRHAHRIEILTNPDDMALAALWRETRVALYPPIGEHFGIVPLEAMARGVPVIAVDAGGPAEIIVDRVCGRLVSPHTAPMAAALAELWADAALRMSYAEAGLQRVSQQFTQQHFAMKIQAIAREARRAD